jgi:GMP synthase-like glutamine amidotransferase
MPKGAEVIASGPDCDVAGFVMGRGVMTTQYHPEMEPAFIAALVEHLADELPSDVTERARASLVKEADMQAMAERIALFIEGQSA